MNWQSKRATYGNFMQIFRVRNDQIYGKIPNFFILHFKILISINQIWQILCYVTLGIIKKKSSIASNKKRSFLR